MQGRFISRFVCLLVSAAWSAGALAAGWYAGGSVGQSRIDVSASEIDNGFFVDDGFVATGTSLDKTDVGWKAYVGYRILPQLAVEAAYGDLGEATFHTTIVTAPPPLDGRTPFGIRATATAGGPQLSGVLRLPLGRVALLARAGVFRWQAKFTERFADTGAVRLSRHRQNTDLLYGAGAQLDVSKRLGARLEWEHQRDVGSGIGGREGRDVDFYSVGLVVSF